MNRQPYTDMSIFHSVLALCMGISLSAACGFRVFVPLLAVALMVKFGDVHVNESLAWVGSDAAVLCLAVATLTEIAAYYIPWVDNLLDSITVPMAAVAGTIITSGMMPDLPGFMQWGIAIVAGGGTAAAISGGTALLRGGSTATTGGLGNCVVSTTENTLAIGGTALAFFSPLLAIIGLVLLLIGGVWFLCRFRRRKKAEETATAAS